MFLDFRVPSPTDVRCKQSDPIINEQAKAFQEGLKAIQEAIKAFRDLGGFLTETFGMVPQDIVGLLGGDWLKVRSAENLAKTIHKAKERLKARGVEVPEPTSLSIALPRVGEARRVRGPTANPIRIRW